MHVYIYKGNTFHILNVTNVQWYRPRYLLPVYIWPNKHNYLTIYNSCMIYATNIHTLLTCACTACFLIQLIG